MTTITINCECCQTETPHYAEGAYFWCENCEEQVERDFDPNGR